MDEPGNFRVGARLRVEKICLWSGFAFVPLYLIGFVLVAGFIPPPAPSLGTDQLAALFAANRMQILTGMLICVVSTPLLLNWSVAVYFRMRRIERGAPALSILQLLNGALLDVFFMIPPILWATLAYRTDVHTATMRMLNDFAWIAWIISWPYAFTQLCAVGLCGLAERTPQPMFPRWLCFLTFWAGLSMVPAGIVIYVQSGSFAWNGLFGIYLPLSIYVVTFLSLTWAVARSIAREDFREAGDRAEGLPPADKRRPRALLSAVSDSMKRGQGS